MLSQASRAHLLAESQKNQDKLLRRIVEIGPEASMRDLYSQMIRRSILLASGALLDDGREWFNERQSERREEYYSGKGHVRKSDRDSGEPAGSGQSVRSEDDQGEHYPHGKEYAVADSAEFWRSISYGLFGRS